MNLVAVEGGNKTQREICEKVVHYMIGKLMPRMRTLDIEVQLKNLTGDAVGFCMMEENNQSCSPLRQIGSWVLKNWSLRFVMR